MLTLSVCYRTPLKIAVWVLGVLSIGFGFVTLPIVIAVPFSIVALVLPWLVSRFIFRHRIIWFMLPFSPQSERNRLGTIWFKEPIAGKEFVGLGLLYEDKEWAKDAYRVIKSWNSGRYVDDGNNINVSIVSEGDHRYSMFVYPGQRPEAEDSIRSSFLASQPSNTEASVSRVFYFTTTCADYSDRPEVEDVVASLRRRNRILLGTFYCDGDDVHPFAKRKFQVNHFKFEDRENLSKNCLEYNSTWQDGRTAQAESAKRTDQLSKKMFGQSPQEKA